jgi:hypothetical protein
MSEEREPLHEVVISYIVFVLFSILVIGAAYGFWLLAKKVFG